MVPLPLQALDSAALELMPGKGECPRGPWYRAMAHSLVTTFASVHVKYFDYHLVKYISYLEHSQ